jgi:fucose permease
MRKRLIFLRASVKRKLKRRREEKKSKQKEMRKKNEKTKGLKQNTMRKRLYIYIYIGGRVRYYIHIFYPNCIFQSITKKIHPNTRS